MISMLGICFVLSTDGKLEAFMPVNQNSMQPFGYLHGGASIALAESLASAACLMELKEEKPVFASHLDVSHLKSLRKGKVHATQTLVHSSGHSQVRDVEIHDEEKNLICICRITLRIKTN